MRLIVAESRVAQRSLALLHPKDHVVCVGDPLHGIQVTEIVDRSHSMWTFTEQTAQWWEQAQCRIKPQ